MPPSTSVALCLRVAFPSDVAAFQTDVAFTFPLHNIPPCFVVADNAAFKRRMFSIAKGTYLKIFLGFLICV